MNKQLSLIIFAVIVSVMSIKAQQNEKNLLEHQKEILNCLDEYNVPAVGIGIIKDGKILERKVFGVQRKGVPVNDNTIFTISFCHKTSSINGDFKTSGSFK